MANLSSKELSSLEDQLEIEKVFIKKYNTFATQCTDPVLQNKFMEIAAKHQAHYNTLIDYLR
ncbi:MAG: spore coat protein [Clostridiales bacterium]|jgi:hypothetical protein|nr:spore coat protein [Clostridiales bacterium]